MNMIRCKHVLMLLLAFSLLLSACSTGSGTAPEPAPAPSEPAEKTGQEAPAAKAEPDPTAERLELNWHVVAPPNAVLPEGGADFITSTIEEKFNVDLNIQYMGGGADYDNKLNLLVASGDTPDFFLASGAPSQKFIQDGIAADMTSYVTPEKMPNYFKWVSEIELQRYAVEKKFMRAPAIFPRSVYRSYYIRTDWLKNLGLEMPTNYDEMMEVMRAFTFDDPDGNNKNDTYGFGAVGNGRSLSFDFPQFIRNGLIGALFVRDNQYVDVQTDAALQHVLQGVKDMAAEGIVDPDWFLMKGTEHWDKAAQGKIGIVLGGTMNFAFDSNPTSLQNNTKALNPEANWMPFHPFAETGTWTENLPGIPFLFSAETAKNNPEKIERIVQILDWISSEEGFLLINYGQEGKHYSRSGNTITVTQAHLDAVKKDVIEQGDFQGIYRNAFYTNAPESEPLGLEVIDESMTDRDREIVATIKSYKLIPSIGTNVAPPPGFVLADFRKKNYEYQAKVLFEDPDASNWPKYREDLMTNFGGQAMLDAYTEQIKAAGVIN